MNYLQTQKFNDNSVSIRVHLPFQKDTITAINLFVYMMKSKTEKFNTKLALASALNNAYGTRAFFSINAYGQQVCLDAKFQYIHEKWIEDDTYITSVIEIIDQILFHPVFDEPSLEEAKYFLENRILRQEDDSDSYAILHALKQIDIGHSISTLVSGYKEDIENITLEDINNVYKEYLAAKRHLYFIGECSEEMKAYLELLDSHVSFHAKASIVHTDHLFEAEKVRDGSQCTLAQVYETGVSVDSKQYYASLLFNAILGQSPTNLLFKEVREKHSYCYSIGSSLIRFDGALLVRCGTRNAYVQDVQRLIAKQIDTVASGHVTDDMIEVAKLDYIDGIESGTDYPFTLIEQAYLDEMLGRNLALEQRKDKIMAVTKEDICSVAKQLKLISVFTLKEANDDEI